MIATTELSFIHRFEPATEPGRPPLLLLHGTGGNEDDLLPLGRMLSPGSALLSPRGKVLEGRHAALFPSPRRGHLRRGRCAPPRPRLADFIAQARSLTTWQHRSRRLSNGANIAAALLQLWPEALAGAALLRAMVPLQNPPAADSPASLC